MKDQPIYRELQIRTDKPSEFLKRGRSAWRIIEIIELTFWY